LNAGGGTRCSDNTVGKIAECEGLLEQREADVVPTGNLVRAGPTARDSGRIVEWV
jgi:hypothetical protein